MDPVIIWIGSILIAALFITAGWHKLNHPDYYRVLIMKYIPMPGSWSVRVQWLVGSAEIAIACFIILPATRQLSAWMAVGLLIFYSLLLAISLLRGLDIDCGCSGPFNKQRLSPWLLLRNTLLTGIAFMATWQPVERLLGFQDYLLIGLASMVAVFIYISFEQLLENQEKLSLLRDY